MGKIDISLIALDSIYGLKVHETEIIPISDYKLQSSANGERMEERKNDAQN